MKWYKKQIDQLRALSLDASKFDNQQQPADRSKLTPTQRTGKIMTKKRTSSNPVVMRNRNRAKTDSI
ncbi:MAG: hypothetical protein EXS55_02440 [Candidatus Magasanikbacteria bacterium]|nr:hypothetical protein [Candidatus Magasanikbacteria bacterium]